MGRGAGIRSEQREAALDMWATYPQASGSEIAEMLCIGHGALNTLIRRARAKGDVRAVPRAVGPVLGSSFKGSVAARIHGMHELGMETARIAKAVGCRPSAVTRFIAGRARSKAEFRQRGCPLQPAVAP